jgi:hypothetical protein
MHVKMLPAEAFLEAGSEGRVVFNQQHEGHVDPPGPTTRLRTLQSQPECGYL